MNPPNGTLERIERAKKKEKQRQHKTTHSTKKKRKRNQAIEKKHNIQRNDKGTPQKSAWWAKDASKR